MGMTRRSQAGLTLLLAATGLGVAGCNEGGGHPNSWSNQWYRKGHTPEDVAKWERKHPNHPTRSGDSTTDETGGYPGAHGPS